MCWSYDLGLEFMIQELAKVVPEAFTSIESGNLPE